MAKINKIYKHIKKAQSTLEYALILPFLFLMILAILELAMLWHENNTIEMITQNISANVSLDESASCIAQENMDALLNTQSAILDVTLQARSEISPNIYLYNSNETYSDGKNFVTIKIDCSNPQSASVQTSAYYKMLFFAASLPNFSNGQKIVILPDRIKLTSNRITTLNKY